MPIAWPPRSRSSCCASAMQRGSSRSTSRCGRVFPARVKAGQWNRIVRGLIETPDGHGTAAHAALQRITALLARRGMVVLISDLLFDRELALAALRYLRHRGHQVVVFHLMDPAEAELGGPPEVRF